MLGGITMSKQFRLFPFLLLICVICFFPVTSVFADGENGTDKKEIDISISPIDALFAISNMKPGDWAPRTITVKNSGSKDFDYLMQLQNSGEKKLFNEFLLEIKAGDKELYKGKLAEFKSLPARKLTSGTEENLDITLRFPEHLGNDFQGLTSAFVFSFTVEGRDDPGGGGETPGGGGETPGGGGETPGGGGETPGGGGETPGGGGETPGGGGETPGGGGETPGGGSETPGGGSETPGGEGDNNPAVEGSDDTAVEENDDSAVQVMIQGQIDSGGPTSGGFRLPDTSTNLFNLMFFGIVLVVGGIVLMIIRHFRRMKIAQ